jgi:phage shock protein A
MIHGAIPHLPPFTGSSIYHIGIITLLLLGILPAFPISKHIIPGGYVMGIFTRVRDIINSNINGMLDRAEDPEKLIRLMIHEMEETLIEIKAACAGAMANKKKVNRALDEAQGRAENWGEKAELAINKGREDLAREALMEKRRWRERADSLQKEMSQCQALVEEYQEDISQLETKLNSAREKQRILIERAIHAQRRRRAQEELRRIDTTDAWIRFEQFENRIERMEAEADLVNMGRKSTLEQEFARLGGDEEIERELERLKASLARAPDEGSSGTKQGISGMEERIEALETIMLDDERERENEREI